MTAFTHLWRIPLILGALVLVACGFVSQAYANEADVEILEMQVKTLQIGLQILQEPLLVSSVATSTTGGTSCINGAVRHRSGAVIGSLALKNGSTSNIRGFQYRCTNGRWIFERVTGNNTASSTNSNIQYTSVPRPSGTSSTSTLPNGQCRNRFDNIIYNNGQRVTNVEYVLTMGETMPIFVCKNGRIVKVETVQSATCRIKKQTYAEGRRVPSRMVPGFGGMPRNRDKDEDRSRIAQVECKGGKWVPVTEIRPCRTGKGNSRADGSTMRDPFMDGRPASTSAAWSRFGPYTCNDGTWVPGFKATTTRPIPCPTGTRASSTSASTRSQSIFPINCVTY